MKRLLLSLLSLLSLVLPLLAEPLSIDSLLRDSLLQYSQMGLMVYDLDADSTLIAVNQHQTLRPASTQKLITAITALSVLGPDYAYRTRIYYKGTRARKTLSGSLICQGGMDPLFAEADMQAIVEAVRALEIDTLRGDIVADLSMKDDKPYGEGWCWDDKNPTLTPLLYKRKDQFVACLTTALQQAGVVIEPTRCEARGARCEVVEIRRPLCDVLTPMMKESDNLFAESLFYQVAAASGKRNAGARQAKDRIAALLRQLGFNGKEYRVADGSGLSLYNYTSPEILVSLLRYAYSRPDIYNALLPTLPIAGVDGTLKKRMCGTSAERQVQAKTGTLSGVISLAGYATAANGHRLCFAIMNQGVLRGREARAWQDLVCQWMTQ